MKSEFFQSFKLPVVIGTIPKDSLTTRLVEYAVQLVKYHNPELAAKKYDISYHPKYDQLVYVVVTTSPNLNHPYVIFANLSTDIINMVIPYGNEQKQAPMQEIPTVIKYCSIMEKYALYLAILKSIDMRKSAILESDQYGLLKCENISNCAKKFNEIKKMKVSKDEKIEMIKEYQRYYVTKAVAFLKIYFNLLTAGDYNEARDFLKGDKGKYFGKQRLNTFFKNSKSIIGHLHIFIPLYQYGAILNQQIDI